ncbi:hypothetical protein ACFXJ5_41070 [Streptomyces sp. NPDC059373]
MTSNSNVPAPRDDEHETLRVYLLLLAMVVGLLIAGAAIYLVHLHPSLGEPLGVGAAVVAALATVTGVAARAVRRR